MAVTVFLRAISIEAKARMTYRWDFWISAVVGFFTEFAVVYFLWTALFSATHTKEIAGFDSSSIYLYYLAVIILSKIIQGTGNANDTSQDIYQGNLNKYLLFPVHYLSFKYAQFVGRMLPGIIQFVLFTFLSITLIRVSDDLSFSLPAILMGFIATIYANLLFFLIDFLLQLSAFWIGNVWSLQSLKAFVATTLGGYMFPVSMFPQTIRKYIELMPFRFLYSVPVNSFFGRYSFHDWLIQMMIATLWILLFLLLSWLVWKKGRVVYTGIGI